LPRALKAQPELLGSAAGRVGHQLDLADAAADLEDLSPVESPTLQELDHLSRGLIEASIAVATRRAKRG
jgi:hypothetical protein